MITDRKGRELTFAERVDPASTALLVVDVQNDFALSEGVVAKGGKQVSAAQEMLGTLQPLIEDARAAGLLIVYVQTGYDEPVLSPALAEQFARRGFNDSLCKSGTSGVEIVESIAPRGLANEVVVRKHRYSPFGGSDIDLVLRSNGIETVVITGIVTEVCVESTARDAFFRDYRVVMATDCASPFSEPAGAASQAVLNQTFGRLATAAELRAIWNAASPGERNWHAHAKVIRTLRSLPAKVAPEHTAMVLVGLQNDVCDPQGAVGKAGAGVTRCQQALPRIRDLLKAARAAGTRVIHVLAQHASVYSHVGSPDWSLNRRTVAPASCLAGTWGAEPIDGIGPLGDEQVVVAHRLSGFVDSRLELLLRANGAQTVVLAGFATHGAVEATARDASMRDFHCVVVQDCVASADADAARHDVSLDVLAHQFADIVPAQAVVAAWNARPQPAPHEETVVGDHA